MNLKSNIFKLTLISVHFVACTKATPVVELFSKPQGLTLSIENLNVNENSEFVLSGTCIEEVSAIEVSFDQGSSWSNIQSSNSVTDSSVLCSQTGAFQFKSLQTLTQLKLLQNSTSNAEVYIRGLWAKGTTEEVIATISPAPLSGPPTISISTSQTQVSEGSNAQVTLTLSSPASEVISLTLMTSDLSAHSGLHYTSVNQTVTFNPGENSKIIPISTLEVNPTGADPACEPDHEFKISMSNPVNSVLNSTTDLTFVIQDNDVPNVSISASPTVSESSGIATYNLLFDRKCETKTITINVVKTHITTDSSDLNANSTTISIAPNTLPSTQTISFSNDSIDEENETFKVEIQNATNALIQNAAKDITFTILDDDAEPSLSFSSNSSTGTEGTTININAELSSVSGKDVQFKVKVNAGTASAGDYITNHIGNLLTIPKGSTTATISLNIVDDTDFELPETLILEIYNNSNSTLSVGSIIHTLTIQVSDNLAPTASNKTYFMNSSDGSISILAKRNDANTSLPFIGLDPTSSNLQIQSITNQVGGNFSGTGNSSLTFSPSSSFFGVASAEVQLSDGFLLSPTVTIKIHVMNPFTWTGAVNNEWNNKDNWCGSVKTDKTGCLTPASAPTLSDDVFLDDTCLNNCTPTLNDQTTIRNFYIKKNRIQISNYNLFVTDLYLKGITDSAVEILSTNGISNALIIDNNLFLGAYGAKGNALLKLYGSGNRGIYADSSTAPIVPNIPSLYIASSNRSINTNIVQNGSYFKVAAGLNYLSMSPTVSYIFKTNSNLHISMETIFPFSNLTLKNETTSDFMFNFYNENFSVSQNFICETTNTGKIQLYKSGGVGVGNISIEKNVQFLGNSGCTSPGQSVQIELSGNSTQLLSTNTNNILNLIIEKAAGTVQLETHFNFMNSEIKSNSSTTLIDLNGKNLYVLGNTSFMSGTKIYRNDGQLFVDGNIYLNSTFSGANIYNGAIP